MLLAPPDSPGLYPFLSFKYARPWDTEGPSTDFERKLTAKVFAGGGWEMPSVVEAMTKAEDFSFDTVSHPAMRHTSFLSGQGSSMALIGAYVLAGELASHSDHGKAFDACEVSLRNHGSITD